MPMRISIAFLIFSLVSTFAVAQIDGVYNSSCLPMGSGHDESYAVTLKIAGIKVESELRFYSDPACGFEAFKINYQGEANYPEGIYTGPFDQRIVKGTFVSTDPQFLKNKNVGCDTARFIVGKKNDLKSLGNCAPLSVPKPGEILFDIFRLNGEIISFGAYPLLWITDEEKRPVLLGGVGLKRQGPKR